MYRAFNIIDCEWKAYREAGDAICAKNRTDITKSLEPFTTAQIVDGTKLTDYWFPSIKADVFISHSHTDEDQAIRCAGWLKNEFGLEPFIDSCAWGYANELLKIIDNKYCLNPGGETYNYSSRNGSTSHVHMMLSSALSRMIDETECVMFIKTDNSITSSESVDKTQSPWLFFELGTMRIIRRKKPVRKVEKIRSFSSEALDIIKAAEFKAEYEVPLSELTPLSSSQLGDWHKAHKSNTRTWKTALDLLYDIVGAEIT